MSNYGFASCFYPAFKSKKGLGFPKFPEVLGKESTKNRKKRLFKHARGDVKSLNIGNIFECGLDVIIQEFISLCLNDKLS